MGTAIHEFHAAIRWDLSCAGDLLDGVIDVVAGTPMPYRDAVALAAVLERIADGLAALCDQAVSNHALAGHGGPPADGSPLTTGEHFRAAERRARETVAALHRAQTATSRPARAA